MVQSFFHGVQTRYLDTVPRSVQTIPTAVILLVGSAPTYKAATPAVLNRPTRCINDLDDVANFGSRTRGWTIPAALDAIRANGGGTVEVINVWDPATDTTQAQNINYTFPTTGTDANRVQLRQVTGTAPSQTIVAGTTAEGLTGVTVTGTGGSPTYALNTDYTLNAQTGLITRVTTGTIPAGGTVRTTYTYADPTKVVASDIIGGVVSGVRTGLQAGLDVFGLRGYRPKIIICPGFSELTTVATEMVTIASTLEAYALLDAPANATRDEAIAGRAGTAPVTNFGTASRRAVLCYPRVFDNQNSLQPYSQFLAGVIARTDSELGYWWSPSNKQIRGITGIETNLTADFTNANTDVNALNAAGITTIYNNFGTGFLTWGNRSALFPSDTTPLNFTAVGRTLDIFHESLQRASLPYVDRPINEALIDAIEATGNGFIREQVILGALLEGSRLYYDRAKNPATALAAGRITFSIVLMIPTPAENIIYESTLDINLLSQLGQGR